MRAGYLDKLGSWRKNWKRRWFVLSRYALRYYEQGFDETDPGKEAKLLLGEVHLCSRGADGQVLFMCVFCDLFSLFIIDLFSFFTEHRHSPETEYLQQKIILAFFTFVFFICIIFVDPDHSGGRVGLL